MAVFVSSADVEQFRTEGYFLLEGAISADHLALLRDVCGRCIAEMDAEMDRQGTDVLGINHRGKRYFCGQAMSRHSELGAFLFGELMAAICRATLGDTAFLHNDQFVAKCGATGMQFSWHQDGAYVRHRIGDHPVCITCWCALDDVDERNGTISILPMTRFGRRELVEHIKDETTNDKIGYFGDDPGEAICAAAGSIAVFSSLTLHRSGPNHSGSLRRAYLAQYAPVRLLNAPGEFPQYYGRPFLEDGRPIQSPEPH